MLKINYVHFLVQMRTIKFAYEIYRPLVVQFGYIYKFHSNETLKWRNSEAKFSQCLGEIRNPILMALMTPPDCLKCPETL